MHASAQLRSPECPRAARLLTGTAALGVVLLLVATGLFWHTAGMGDGRFAGDVSRNPAHAGLLVLGLVLLGGAWVGLLRQCASSLTRQQQVLRDASQSEARHLALLHALPDTSFVVDRAGVFLDFHARPEASGFSGSWCAGQRVAEAFPPDVAGALMQAVAAALASGETRAFEFALPHLDATGNRYNDAAAFHFEARIVPCGDDRALAIVRDITERKHAEQTVREAEHKFRILVEQSHTGIYIYQDDRIVYANPRLAAIVGYGPDEIQALPTPLELVVPEDRGPMRDRFTVLAQEGHHAHVTARCLRRDGSICYVELFGSIIEYQGRRAVLGTMLDVTEQREAQEKLRVLGMAVEQSAEGVLVIDPNGIVCFANPAWTRMHGFTEEEVTGEHFRIFHTAEQMRRDVFPVINRFEKMHIARAEVGHKRKDGSTFPSQTAFATLRAEDGRVIGAVGICRDITEQKLYEAELLGAKERAEEMARLKTAFLTNMSHELRTPLTGILGFAAVLEEEVPEAQREFAHLVRQSGERLMQTLNAVLDLARLEAGELQLAPHAINLRREVEETASVFRLMAAEKRVALHVLFSAPSIPACLDPDVLAMILGHLIGNAVKFTEAGEVRVEVTAAAEHVQIQVSDTGVGMDAAFLPHLFEEFQQESAGLTRTYEGSGLGLSITKRLVGLMGGAIAVESTKGCGSTFTVTLPRYAPALANVA